MSLPYPHSDMQRRRHAQGKWHTNAWSAKETLTLSLCSLYWAAWLVSCTDPASQEAGAKKKTRREHCEMLVQGTQRTLPRDHVGHQHVNLKATAGDSQVLSKNTHDLQSGTPQATLTCLPLVSIEPAKRDSWGANGFL